MVKNYMDNKIAWQKSYIRSQKDILSKCIALGVLAPSTHNCQPWRFNIVTDKKVDIYVRDDIDLTHSDHNNYYRLLSIGAMIENMAVAASGYGYKHAVSYHKKSNNGPVASFIIKSKSSATNTKMIDAIYDRYSEKRINQHQNPLPNELMKLFCSNDGVLRVYSTNDINKIKNIAKNFYESALSYSNNRPFAKELSNWMRKDSSKSYDGMPAASSGLSNFQLVVGTNILKITPKILKPMSKKYLKLVGSSDAVGCITTDLSNISNIIKCGSTFESIALKLTCEGYSVTALAAIVDNDEYNEKLRLEFSAAHKPVIFFRVAPAQNHNKTPRYNFEKLIITRLAN